MLFYYYDAFSRKHLKETVLRSYGGMQTILLHNFKIVFCPFFEFLPLFSI